MKATHRVKNSNGKTMGFIIDNNYIKYFDALKNINFIDNMTVTINGIIKSKQGQLKDIDIKEVNEQIYGTICQQNPLVRDIQTDLEYWKQEWNRYVLYLTGARQIGKTTELLKFAYKNYEQIIYVNIADEESLNNFETLVLSNSLRFGMMNYCRKARLEEFIDNHNTILIIDEIQESSKVYNSIRALQSGLNCHVAVTGSYLGKILNSKYFKPVGNMYEVEMLPLSFTEYCRAHNLEELLQHIDLYGGSKKEDYIALTELYKTYINIGGYPAVVTEYMRTKNIQKCYKAIKNIISIFPEESSSYFKNDKCEAVFENVYAAAFINIAKEKKGTAAKEIQDIADFIIEDTKEHVSRKEINNVLSWLKYSKIIGSCNLYNQGNVNDLLYERRFYFMDCGIANYISRLTSIKNDAVKGALAENFVYSELYRVYKKDIVKGNKPCCSVYNNYELDFMLVDMDDKKYGIEVKATKSDKHESLDCFLSKALIDEAYLVEITRGGIGRQVRSIPIYTVGCRFPYN